MSQVRAELQETTEVYESCRHELHQHKLLQEDLTRQISDLSDELEHITKSHQRVIDDLTRKHEDELRKSARTLESKESTLQSTLNDLNRLQALLSQREEDLHDVQDALEGLEEERKRRGEVDTTARFSLQLELDRLKRDLERVEDELSRARKEIDDKEIKVRDKDSVIDKLSSENRDLAAQVAAHTQTKLNLTEKLDLVQGNLRKAESELEGYRSRMGDLEMRLSKDQRSLLNAENQYRDQLTERNTLLLTIYQYMDKILGVDKVAVSCLSSISNLTGTHLFPVRKKATLVKRNHSLISACSMIILSQDSRLSARFNSISINDVKKWSRNTWTS